MLERLCVSVIANKGRLGMIIEIVRIIRCHGRVYVVYIDEVETEKAIIFVTARYCSHRIEGRFGVIRKPGDVCNGSRSFE